MDLLWMYLIFTAAPLYCANAFAMVFGGKTPIDGNRILSDGQPLIGKGKTWKGTGMGILIGTFVGLLANYFFPFYTQSITHDYVAYAFLLSTGALVGDIVGSFIKRRMKLKSGQPAHVLDQLDFVVGGLVFGSAILIPNFTGALLLVMITPFMHLAFNRVAFILKIKSVPW